jgi:hypothetical protein
VGLPGLNPGICVSALREEVAFKQLGMRPHGERVLLSCRPDRGEMQSCLSNQEEGAS